MQPQALQRLDDAGKVADCPRVGQVARLRERAHHEMVLDKPVDEFGFSGRQAQSRSEFAGNAGAENRVILRAALADVVQKSREIERAPMGKAFEQLV